MSELTTGRTPFSTEDSRFARCEPEAILSRVRQPATWPAWQSEIVATEGPHEVSAGDVVKGRALMMGFDVDGQSIVASDDGSLVIENVVVGVGMQVRYEVVAEGTGSRVTHTLTSNLPAGALGSVLSFFLRRRFKKMQRTVLKRLVDQAEASA
jgi:hypothetical protein